MNPTNFFTPLGAQDANSDGQRPVENRLQDALTGFFNPTIDPSLVNLSDDAALNTPDVAPTQATNQGPMLHIPGVGNLPSPKVPRNQLVPQLAPHRHHRGASYAPPMEVSKLAKTPAPRAQFLRNLPPHDYILPAGSPLNFTIAEIISILPNWFRNRDFAIRFQNNGINGGIHFAILDEYRHLNMPTLIECERARDHISDSYRKAMRQVDLKWTKATQKAPVGWNANYMMANNFLPDVAREPGYKAPPSILFKDLVVGLKKLPQGSDAGDLTRALQFAMQNQKADERGQSVEFMFPDDIQTILNHIGRTQITGEHTDPATIFRYGNTLRQAAAAKKEAAAEVRRQEKNTELVAQQGQVQHLQPVLRQAPRQNTQGVFDFALLGGISGTGMQPTGMDSISTRQLHQNVPLYAPNNDMGIRDPASNPYLALEPSLSVEHDATAAVASKLEADRVANPIAQRAQSMPFNFPELPDACRSPEFEQNAASQVQEQAQGEQYEEFTMEDMDAFLAPHQSIDFSDALTLFPELDRVQPYDPDHLAGNSQEFRPEYPPTQLLRDCIEGDNEDDRSDLARAARWARQYGLAANDFTVAEAGFIVQVLDSAAATGPAAT